MSRVFARHASAPRRGHRGVVRVETFLALYPNILQPVDSMCIVDTYSMLLSMEKASWRVRGINQVAMVNT